MIPLIYRLRKEVRIENRGDACLVISDAPLNVVRVRVRVAQILRLCDGQRTLGDVAAESGVPEEEQVLRICEYFNKRGVLETVATQNNGHFPTVTVIIPAKDRRDELVECLESVFSQDYPKGRMDVIVIDDGSTDGTGSSAAMFPCRVLAHKESRGQSYCRNLGAREAQGEILAFLDSDCVAGRDWLKELVTYFQWERVGAVGGRVDGYFDESALDRYEQAFSSLTMGKYILHGTNNNSTVYAPTCNLLVRGKTYAASGGIRDGMHVGEDVDFCWRMRDAGYDLLYVPAGTVRHKHRNVLGKFLRRRADYGTSEATLYRLHPRKKKVFQVPPLAGLALFAICSAILFFSPMPLILAAGCFVVDTAMKALRMARFRVRVSVGRILSSVLRTYFSFAYFLSFHVVRYYFVALLLLGLFFHPLWLLSLFFMALSSVVDYTVKRPYLGFPGFLFYYVLEHASYQLGVFWGCLRSRTFGSYGFRLLRRPTA